MLGGIVAAAAIVILVSRGLSRDDSGSPAAYTTYPPEVVAYGEAIFRSNCASCHGVNGQGDPTRGVPALNGSMHAWHHADAQIAGFIRNGVGRMPAVGSDWSQDDITAVLAFVKQWWDPDQRSYQELASRQNP